MMYGPADNVVMGNEQGIVENDGGQCGDGKQVLQQQGTVMSRG